MTRRPTETMPEDVAAEIDSAGLMDAYLERPFYQRNDYLGWIRRAVKPETRAKRIAQMIDELEEGGVYMRMDHPPSRRRLE